MSDPDAHTFSDGDLPDSCFAYVPDDEPSHRKLKLCGPDGKRSKTIIAAAKAALGKGYRGNKVQLPESARAGVVAKVNAAARSVGIEPFSAAEEALIFDAPDVGDVHVDAPMGAINAMKSHLKRKARRKNGEVSLSDVDEAHRKVRAQLLAPDATTATATSEEALGFCDGGDAYPKLAKADPRVLYRLASASNPTDDGDGDIDHCGACRFYQWGRCQLVEGTIEADHVCSLFADSPITYVTDDDLAETAQMAETTPAAAARRFADLPADDIRQFTAELKPFAEPPEWIQYLPKPGTYSHSKYGQIDLTPERVGRFVQNFNSGVYQKAIPVDAEHQTKLSGATGWIRELRLAADGGAEARVEWTDRGEAFIKNDRFKYFSPEWFDEWPDPVDGTVHRDVAIGGALTTRPYFKERSLVPLVASEGGAAVLWGEEADERSATESTPQTRQGAPVMADEAKTQVTTPAPVGMTEDQMRKFSELEAKVAAEEDARKAAEAVAKAANDRVAKLEAEARRKKFTDEVLGRSDASGIRWFGEPAKHVAFLEKLADAFGEESDEVKAYVETNRATGTALKDSDLFQAFGADAAASTDASPMEQLNAFAEALAGEKKITREQAFAEVVADPKHKALVANLYK